MKKINLAIVFIILLSFVVKGQKKEDPGHTNYYKIPETIKSEEYQLDFKNIVSRMEFSKFEIKVTNTTNDFLIFNRDAVKFEFDFGSFSDKPKEFFVEPNSSKSKVIEVNGTDKFHVDNFKVIVDELYLVPVKGTEVLIEDFSIPASKNIIKHNLFTIELMKSSLKTKEAELIFECVYNGDKIAIVNSDNLVVKVNDSGQEYANDDKRTGAELLKKGDKIKLKAVFHIPGRVADMQFANMTILWKDTFVETEAKKLEGKQVEFEIDPGMTAGKN